MSHFVVNNDEQYFKYGSDPRESVLEYIGNRIDDLENTLCTVDRSIANNLDGLQNGVVDIKDEIRSGLSGDCSNSLTMEVRTLRRAKVLDLAMSLMARCPGKTLQDCLALVNSYVLSTQKDWMADVK